MKNFIVCFSLLLLSIGQLNAQWWSGNEKVNGNREVITQNRTVGDYDRISVTGMMEVELVAGTEGKISLQAESNLMEFLETEVQGGHLKISVEKGVNLRPSAPIKITVPFKDLQALTLTGSGNIRNKDMISAQDFKVSVTGSGNMNLRLKARNLKGTVTGSGDVKLNGAAENFECNVTGSGDFLAYDLKAERVDASVTGSGDVKVSVNKELNARVSGSGDVNYRGNPGKQNFKTSGSGSVSKG